MRDFPYSWILCGPLCRDANNSDTVLFTMFSAFVLYDSRSETWLDLCRTYRIDAHSGQVARVCHTNFLYCEYCVTLGPFGLRRCKSWLNEFSIQVTESTLKMSYFVVFFFFCQGCMMNGRRHIVQEQQLCTFYGNYSTLDWVVHIVDNFVRKTFPVYNAWILAQLDHLASLPGFRSSVYRI